VSARHKRRGDRQARHAKVRAVADVLRTGLSSPFRYEAACRHGLRAQLCLNGWPWEAADQEAHRLVQSALDLLGARRPSYEQGQPDWTHQGVITVERTRCKRCGRPLPEDAWKWCSATCRSAATVERRKMDGRDHDSAALEAAELAWRPRR
jgi:hypothetical protein